MFYHSTEECFNFAEDNGIAVVEIVVDPQDMFIGDMKQNYLDLFKSFSMEKQVHGPFIDINLCSHNRGISQASIEAYLETAQFCKEFHAKTLTIHPGLANFMLESLRDYNRIQLAKAINIILDRTKNLDISICLENMPKNTHIMLDQDNIMNNLKSINRKELFLTYDTSHFYTNNGDVNLLWERYHKIIKNVHLVENFTTESDTHPQLGSGKVDFKYILEIIQRYEYNGALIIELSSKEGLEQSINFISKFL
ncbi:MAG: sugar phosphate isomerase/epimerase [Candidatus Lokiarchaeota archaeon]|nr:sugar phosphate isomerase/epimerase [Candidatus Lokiarchaeota archaeon]